MKIRVTVGAGFVLLVVLLVLMCAAGCAPIEGATVANPRASVQIEPLKGIVKMESSRDDKGRMEGFEATIPQGAPGPLAGTTIKVKELELDASASKPRKANADQIESMGDFNEATGRAWSGVIDSVGSAASTIVGQVMPNAGAWAFKSLFLMIGVPVAAVFAVVVGVCGLLAIVIIFMLAWTFIKRLRAK